MKSNVLFIMPSWEERSLLGFIRDLEARGFDKVILFKYSLSKFNAHVEDILQRIIDKCNLLRVEYSIINITSTDNIVAWQELQSCTQSLSRNIDAYIDITTMPRNIIWALLFFLKQCSVQMNYIYHSPEKYTKEWISKEPDTPRLLIKHSGIIDLGKYTALVIITGFDPDRTRQLIDFYEPKQVYLLVQGGGQFENQVRNSAELHNKVCVEEQVNCEVTIFDAYTQNLGYNAISEIVKKGNEYNLICTSLGPKLSALSLYMCSCAYPDIALCYIPCKEYNAEYCSGIGKTYFGKILLE